MIMQDIVKISKNTLIAKIKEIWIKVMYFYNWSTDLETIIH